MISFWLLSALILIIAILFVVLPLWRAKVKTNFVIRDAANIEILRDQLAEMDADLKNGLLTAELHQQGKKEIEARLLEEVTGEEAAVAAKPMRATRITAIVLAIMVPLASVALYYKLGNLHALNPQQAVMSGEGGAVRTEAGIKGLEEKVAQNPDDPNPLVMLARSYMEAGRYVDSSQAFEKLTKLVPDEAAIWADYADAMAMSRGSLAGPPTKLLEKALALDPNETKALALAGSAAMERGDYPAALKYWGGLRKQLPDGTPDAQMIDEALQQARSFLNMTKGGGRAMPPMMAQASEPPKAAASSGAEQITGTVTLSAALKGKADPEDTLFVLARAAQGPKMPLAIVRKQVKDLPLQFSLDDGMAMAPEMSLSKFNQVVVIARVSKSGNAMTQPGDLQGMSQVLRPGSKGLKIQIDQLVQ